MSLYLGTRRERVLSDLLPHPFYRSPFFRLGSSNLLQSTLTATPVSWLALTDPKCLALLTPISLKSRQIIFSHMSSFTPGGKQLPSAFFPHYSTLCLYQTQTTHHLTLLVNSPALRVTSSVNFWQLAPRLSFTPPCSLVKFPALFRLFLK